MIVCEHVEVNPSHRFVIVALPRSGSTTLARLLALHPDITCLLEPFHTRRYGGVFNRLAYDEASLDKVTDLIWTRWSGLKHVWTSDGHPFRDRPALNDRIVTGPDRMVIIIVRRNFLRRAVSDFICRQLDYWMGSRAEFIRRLDAHSIPRIELGELRGRIRRDRAAIARLDSLLAEHHVCARTVWFEDLYAQDATDIARRDCINELFEFLGHRKVEATEFQRSWRPMFDTEVHQWASPQVYAHVPGIESVESEIGSPDTGWLFR